MEAALPHVVVIAFPFASHAVKLFRLARALAAAAPAATFSFLSTASSLAVLQKQNGAGTLEANLRFVEVADGLPPAAAASSPPHHMARVELFLVAAEAGAVRDAVQLAPASAGGARVTCVVGDAFVWMAADAAAAVAAPWVPVWTGGPSALLVHLRAHALRDDVGDGAASRQDELLTSHPGLGSYRVRDLPDGVLDADIVLPIVVLFRRVAEHLPRAAAVVLNTFAGLVPDDVHAALAAELPECFPVGPFHLLPVPGDDEADAEGDTIHLTDSHGCLAWLDRHPERAVVYISFGTIVSAVTSQEELHELAAGIESTGAPFLWSLPEGSWPQLPAGFLERAKAGAGLVVPWAPQADVLRHASVGAFITHAGWASVLEGVSSGVPMACRPYFSDQRMNARLVAHVWGVGTTLDEPVTRGGVAAASSLLAGAGEEGDRMWERMQELKGMAAGAFAPGGGSTNNLDKLVNKVCAIPTSTSPV